MSGEAANCRRASPVRKAFIGIGLGRRSQGLAATVLVLLGIEVAFKDLPNRFPSVLSLDFSKEQDQYRDFDNLFAMYVLYNMGKYRVKVDYETKLLEIEKSKSPMPYPTAAALATKNARSDSRRFLGGAPFRPSGKALGGNTDNANLYDLSGRADKETATQAPARVDAGNVK